MSSHSTSRINSSTGALASSGQETYADGGQPVAVRNKKLIVKDSRENASSPSLVSRAVFKEAAEQGKQKTGKEGILLQQEKQRWVERFFVIRGTTLYGYKSVSDRDKKTRTRIPFSSILRVHADPSLGKPFAFELEKKKDKIILAASSNSDLLEWVDAITRHITK